MMSTKALSLAVAGMVTAALIGGPLVAQESKAPSAQAEKAPAPTTLRVTVVIARFQGEKKTSSLPFMLIVNAPGRPTSLQVGANVPVPATVLKQGDADTPSSSQTSFQMKSIGTSISCSASPREDGRFALDLTINDNQIFSDSLGTASLVKGVPTFQTFTSQNSLHLRDGQTLQFGTAVDKATGEVIKVDVTLNVIK